MVNFIKIMSTLSFICFSSQLCLSFYDPVVFLVYNNVSLLCRDKKARGRVKGKKDKEPLSPNDIQTPDDEFELLPDLVSFIT